MQYNMIPLPYAFDALEPSIDRLTMETHYAKHYQGYTDKLNMALENTQNIDTSIEELLQNITTLPESIKGAVRNNGGGYYNHTVFWQTMAPGGVEISSDFQKRIVESFGSVENMKNEFTKAATARFGSGWVWLIQKKDGTLTITSTPNQDNPIMDIIEESGYPLLGLDVREHAYYLHYQNRRADYVDAWWDVVDWAAVEARIK